MASWWPDCENVDFSIVLQRVGGPDIPTSGSGAVTAADKVEQGTPPDGERQVWLPLQSATERLQRSGPHRERGQHPRRLGIR